MDTKIFILLPTYNRCEITRLFIESLKAQTHQNYHLLHIDDGSSDSTVEMVSELINNVTVFNGKGHWWWAGCLNTGITWLKKQNIDDNNLILIINDDVIIPTEFLQRGINLLSKSRNTLLLARRQDQYTGKIKETGVCADLTNFGFEVAKSQNEINCLSTRGLFIRWGDIKNIGRFRPFLLPHYGSDYEYTIRAMKIGYRLITSPLLSLTNNEKSMEIRDMKLRDMEQETLWCCMRRLFDRRCLINPIYCSSLVILIYPWKRIIPNLFHVWDRAIRSLLRSLLRSIQFYSIQ